MTEEPLVIRLLAGERIIAEMTARTPHERELWLTVLGSINAQMLADAIALETLEPAPRPDQA